ncbi:putative transcriptional regulator [Neokomagataea thailandica NBRC 106555]|uniref:Transcriptional regulator n=2 Tax=Neokomagataea TaxID=1223423 RepID=A0A4Y6V8S5_9PROT|nr:MULTISPECIES: metalloregulator ArsR/SmtB family transcription factor [Neokomagataea]QDH25021.1 transcriptional regulator [Neokomagataea tanensis]GBR51471.1 putative transcriptional regulator [Neokomagataea thailandica NBRC 106555]
MMDNLKQRAEYVARILKMLAHAERLQIACALAEQEYSVAQLETKLGIHQPALSRHLTILKKEETLSSRREGKNVFYTLTDEKTGKLVKNLYNIYCKGHDL